MPASPSELALLAVLILVAMLGWQSRRTRLRVSAELRQSRADLERVGERLRDLVDDTSDLVMTYTSDGRIRQIDERGCRLLGLDPAQLERTTLRDVVAPSCLPLVALSAADCSNGTRRWGPFELCVHTSGAEDQWLLARVRAVREGERVQAFELVATSIEDQKRAHAGASHASALLEHLADLTTTQGSLSDMLGVVCEDLGYEDAELWRVDERFDVLRLSDAWRSPELPPAPDDRWEMTLGKGFRLPGRAWVSQRPQLASDLRGEAASEPSAADPPFRSGLAFPVRLAGEIVGIVAMHRRAEAVRMPTSDLLSMLGHQIGQFAQRLRAERRLRHSEARNRAILECTAECVVTTNESGEIIDFNPAAERTFGHPRSEVLGRPVVEVLVPAEHRGQDLDVFSHYLTHPAEPGGAEIETLGLRADGTQVPIEVAITRVWAGEGTVLTAFLRDISHRKEIERLKDELVSTVSHELRTPLASVRGFVELLLLRDYSVAEQKKFLCIIDAELKRLTRLINDFLDLQRIETGKQTYDLRPADLVPLLQDCVEVSSGSTSEHALALDCEAPSMGVRMDVDRIQQVVMNLLSNAVKFSPTGGRVSVSARFRGDHVQVDVRDAGLGMPPEVVEKLFSKFYRADSSATRKIQGTGLGLALVREIVVAHGGEVHVESEPDRGSVFSFTLPRCEADELERSSDPAATRAPLFEGAESPQGRQA